MDFFTQSMNQSSNQPTSFEEKLDFDDFSLFNFSISQPSNINEEKSSYNCPICRKDDLSTSQSAVPSFLSCCQRPINSTCFARWLSQLIESKRLDLIICPFKSCGRELDTSDIQTVLSNDMFEQYLQLTLMAFIEQDQSSFICPNNACRSVISIAPFQPPSSTEPITECNEAGVVLSRASYLHFCEFRVRCRDCNLNFCASCRFTPYHKGFTCQQFSEYQSARHCRFCSATLESNNQWPNPTHSIALRDVCTEADCVTKAEQCCAKMLACGCPCGGIKDESPCLPCLTHDLDIADEFCGVCYVEALKDAPCIKSTGPCTHTFHFACVKTKIESRWPGARVSFEFRGCPVCKQTLNHPAIAPLLAPVLEMEASVHDKALARLKYEQRDKDPAIITKGGEFFHDPLGFALKSYVFYQCFKCSKAYFGGGYQCQEAASGQFDPSELICPGCQPSSVEDCKVHGKDWLAYKCKFCCSFANWYCWGNTHFCDRCHKSGVWQNLTAFRTGKNKKKLWEYDNCPSLRAPIDAIAKDNSLNEDQKTEAIGKLLSNPKECSLGRHPPTGLEFGLGCSMCEDSQTAGDTLKENEAAVRAKLELVKAEIAKTGFKKLVYNSDFDQNGLMWYLGTCALTKPYTNPAEAGFVRVVSSGLMGDSAPLSAAVGRELVRCVTTPVRDSWFTFELLDLTLTPTAYTLKHYNSWDTECLRNWVLEGSTEGAQGPWEILITHSNDTALAKKGATYTWQIPQSISSQPKKYRAFRLFQNGRNSNNNFYLPCSGLEFYGTLWLNSPLASVAAAAPVKHVSAPIVPLLAPPPGPRPFANRVFNCVSDLDTNGICYFLGCKFGTSSWSNPAELGLIRVTCSELAFNPPSEPTSAVVGRGEAVRCVSVNNPGQWFAIDFSATGYRIRPSAYTLRHYSSWDLEALRYWRFEGSINGVDWFVLMVHNNDASLDRKGATHTWPLPNQQGQFSMFRVTQTGVNSNNHHFLALSGFEIYGQLCDAQLPLSQPFDMLGAASRPLPFARPPVPVSSPLNAVDASSQHLVEFKRQSDMDMNGLFYFLGSRGGRSQWQNPHDLQLVTVTSSPLALSPPSAPASAIVNRQVCRCVTVAGPSMWFAVDLRSHSFCVTEYTLQHYDTWDTEAVRNWRMEGSADGVTWEIIRQHVEDKALNRKGQAHSWSVPLSNRFYSHFRIVQTGPNSNQNHYLALCGFELYGVLKWNGAVKSLPVPPRPDRQPSLIAVPPSLPSQPPALPASRPSLNLNTPRRSLSQVSPLASNNPFSPSPTSSNASNHSRNPFARASPTVQVPTTPSSHNPFAMASPTQSNSLASPPSNHFVSSPPPMLSSLSFNQSTQQSINQPSPISRSDSLSISRPSYHPPPGAGARYNDPFSSPSPITPATPISASHVTRLPPPPIRAGRPFHEGMEFIYSYDFDEGGILYWLGTRAATQQWRNPDDLGVVKVTSVDLALNPPSEPASALVGRQACRCVTQPSREGWFIIDFQTYFIRPTHYTLRHYDSYDSEALRDWKLQGSNDGSKWTKLLSHKKDESLQGRGSSHTWPIPTTKKAFRMFRILQTGKNSNGHWYCALSGFEIYGQLFATKPKD